MDYGKWLDRGLDKGEPKEKTIRTQNLAERMGFKNGTYLYKFIAGERTLSKKQIAIAAEFFGEPDPTIKPRANGAVAPPGDNRFVDYPILGVVEAGAFREADVIDNVEPRTVTLQRDDVYPNATPMAWEVRGDSMNRMGLVDGTIAHGVDFQQAGAQLANGMVVVVEQNRDGLIERSIKSVALFPDRVEFQPRSYNPVHRPIVYRNGHTPNNLEVRVLTLVRGAGNRY